MVTQYNNNDISNKSGVYRLDWSNGYFYIGQSQNLRERWRTHIKGIKTGSMLKHQRKLYRVWNKYGEPKFTVILYSPIKLLNDIEQSCIDVNWGNKMLCNISPSSRNCRGIKKTFPAWNKGIPRTLEEKIKISIGRNGKYIGENSPRCKISKEKCILLFNDYKSKNYKPSDLARKYEIGRTTLFRIVSGNHWTKLK